MLRSLAGPYRRVYGIMVLLVVASLVGCAVHDLRVLNDTGSPGAATLSALNLAFVVLGFYFLFRTGSAHFERVRRQDSRVDLIGPLVLVIFLVAFGLAVATRQAFLIETAPLLTPLLMLALI